MTTRSKKMTPRKWAWLAFGFMFLLSPIDIIPDCIPVFGNLDDASVMALVIKKVLEEDEEETK
jgi:uncharacterized membrane protein YkvA (DUF1232 family)